MALTSPQVRIRYKALSTTHAPTVSKCQLRDQVGGDKPSASVAPVTPVQSVHVR